MKAYKGFESKVMGDFEQLPSGGYVCEIKQAEEIQNQRGGSRLEISVDIAEGEYKGYFANMYKADTREDKKWRGKFIVFLPTDDGTEKDGWAKNRFNNIIGCIEEGNAGYHWDWNERGLRGKKIALVFRREEYAKNDGTTGWTVKPFKCITIDKCREGKCGKFDDKPLNNGNAGGYAIGAPSFAELPDDDDLPF